MNIKHTELTDALVLTASDIKIICCDRCCITVALVHTINRLEVLVGKKRLELLNLSVLVPKTSA